MRLYAIKPGEESDKTDVKENQKQLRHADVQGLRPGLGNNHVVVRTDL